MKRRDFLKFAAATPLAGVVPSPLVPQGEVWGAYKITVSDKVA